MPVADDVRLASDVRIFLPELVNLYGCTVGSETTIGPFVEIQRNVIVGARCKISSHTFICEGVTLEDEVFVGHGVMFTNDLFPADRCWSDTITDWQVIPTRVTPCRDWQQRQHPGRVTVGIRALIGAGAVIAGADYAIRPVFRPRR
jgi:acetyltransferase-like isoleucine patch superfamily enzyme